MDRLDKAIADTAYILDSLKALREITQSGCCNNCMAVSVCKCKPRPGQMVRYNCPFYAGSGKE